MQAHQARQLLDRRGRRVGAHVAVMALAVLVDLVGKRAQAPVLGARHGAAIVLEDLAEMLDKTFRLGVGEVLARNEDMLVESHCHVPFVRRASKHGGADLPNPYTRGDAIY